MNIFASRCKAVPGKRAACAGAGLKALAAASIAAAAVAAPAPAWAAYPDKPIQVIISFPPGGATDVLARSLGNQLGQELGQSIVVENRPGAGGGIGLAAGARGAPSGYELYLAATTNQAIAAAIYNQPVHLAKDFVPIGVIGFVPHALVAPIGLPVKNVAELITYIKAKPGAYNYASQGVGTLSHLEGSLFTKQNGLEITHVPYKGSSQALPDVVNGTSIMMFDSVTGSMPMVKGGKLKYLAVASGERISLLPDVPTLKESGIKNVVADNGFGLFAPKGTPPAVITTLTKALEKALKNTKLIESTSAQGATLRYGGPDALAKLVDEEHVFWGNVVKDAKISVN